MSDPSSLSSGASPGAPAHGPAFAVDRWLWRRGFGPGPVREGARTLILLAAVLLGAGAALLPLTAWPFWLGAGTTLSAWNFYHLALFVQRAFPSGNEGGANSSAARRLLAGQLARSNLRLFITGFFVYMALVVFHANPFALAAGLSAAVLVLPFLFRRKKRAKNHASL
ncbi:MAG: hypothetical protein J1E80_05390 [Desulfovibrionaceae bacterium]|nr:hypothetical protein [Desulfovibrionaceae bacterium]